MSYIAHTWKETLANSPGVGGLVSRGRFYWYANSKIDKLLFSSQVLVARDMSDRRHIVGWIAYDEKTRAVCYIYVRDRYRKRRIGSSVVADTLCAVVVAKSFEYAACLTEEGAGIFSRLGLRFRPSILWGKNEKSKNGDAVTADNA
ncbi:MAG: hypothetical protein E6Q97_37435 [Desulfurellales bacterium]|nr:MAG: hypothetical protein E6Q97_37435 [Desulfurellales bacterium]